jgi:FkbM family methyltransferase
MADVVTYAQNREDLYIASFFPDVENGFYVDVGAHHPVRDSVTKYFSLRGWTGINIEPQRKYYELLEVDRANDVNLNIGISDSSGSLDLREFPGDGLSTFSDAMKSEYEQDEDMRAAGHIDYEVRVETLANVFAQHVPEGQTVHFLKVDVEGLEYQVLRGNDWSRFRPILVCVEANHIVQDWHRLLADASYDKVLFDGLNEYFLAKEHGARTELFAFASMFLTGKQIRPFFLNSHVEDLNSRIEQLRTEVAGLNAEHAEALAKHAEALARITEVNTSLETEAQRWQQAAASLQDSNKSIRFHMRSLYQLVKERAARRFDRPGSRLQQSGTGRGRRGAMAVTHIGAQSFLGQIDEFVTGNRPEDSQWTPPPVVSVPLFQGKTFKARVANRLSYWPLRIIRRSTTAYWRSEQQIIFQLSQEIESLKFRVTELNGEVQRLERRGSE